ncbi:MAG: hypothetical protein M3430_05430 [Acidobacteriota bacterium]|nr:hypothetical protein [Acidobacteriota bacterium]
MSLKLPSASTPSRTFKAGCLFLFVFSLVLPTRAVNTTGRVVCRPEFAAARRRALADQLREITGFDELYFDADGALRHGDTYSGGSPAARELVLSAISGQHLLIFEDASNRDDVVFCRIVGGRWVNDAAAKPPVQIVLIDFADFSRVTGDREALAAFNVGWGVLHELSHAVHNSLDAHRAGEVGECEELINRMRRECALAERAEYFFTFYPGMERSAFKTRYVRLAFEQQRPETGKKRRLWLMWDAVLVGGLK